MTVLDAYAVIAYLRGENAADEVAELLRSPTQLSAANQAEVIDQLVRVFARPADDVEADLALLTDSGMQIAVVDSECAVEAGRLRAQHYHRERCAVSLADCVAAATALRGNAPCATSDPALATLIRAEGGTVIALPDRQGRRP
jgi:PIN domain nuclease of toxin-antitoxin system